MNVNPRFGRHFGLFCAFLVAASLLVGCVSMPSGDSQAGAAGEALFRDGDLRAAAVAFVDAANSNRRERNALLLRAAEAWRENGDRDAVASVIVQIDARKLSGDQPLRYTLLKAELALDAGDSAGAAALLDADPGRSSRALRSRYHELRGRALEPSDAFVAAAEFARLDALVDGDERRENARRVRDVLAKLSDGRLTTQAGKLASTDPLRPFVARAISARGLSLPASLRDANVRRSTPVRAAEGGHIALLLPLTGPLRAAGVPVRDGFLAARFASGDRPTDVRVMDSGDTAESAVAAYQRAVADGASQVVGPLTREAVTAVLSERDLPVPVLALNRGIGPLPPGQMSFALTPEDEAAAVARLLSQRGLLRVLAVTGQDELAQRTLEAFRARHAQSEGQLVAVATLPASGVDYRSAIREAQTGAGLPTESPRDLTLPFDPGVDAVFIAVRPEQARLLVPQLKLAGLINVPTIGTSMLHVVDDNSRQDRELDDVEFTELPWLLADLPGLPARGKLRLQLETAGGPSARLFAFGMDAWRLLSNQHLLMDADLPMSSATGELSLDAFGEARSQPIIARFSGGVARPVDSGGLLPQ
ncbi:MAG: penicillin-binding protein activator [Pseudomarimonas sp.]